MVGYYFESVMGLLFAISLAFHKPFASEDYTKYGEIIKESCTKYFECAVFFAASIQIACVIVLVRQNFGISANGLGGFTVQITWAIALLCMLPLTYPMAMLEWVEKGKSGYRLFLFCGCWLLFFYTFISQMIGDFSVTQVGAGAGPGGVTIVTTDEWNILNSLCLTGVNPLSSTEQRVLSGFGAAGSLFISSYGLVCLLWFIATKQGFNWVKRIRSSIASRTSVKNRRNCSVLCLIIVVPLLSIPQFWGVMRLRSIQKALANSTNNAYTDNQWTFGQVVAVMIFAPVFTDMGYAWMQKRRKKMRALEDTM